MAWRRIEEVPKGEGARAWLYGVARKVLANHHRGNRRRQGLDERLAMEIAGLINNNPAAEGPDRGVIAAALAALNPNDRELLTLLG